MTGLLRTFRLAGSARLGFGANTLGGDGAGDGCDNGGDAEPAIDGGGVMILAFNRLWNKLATSMEAVGGDGVCR